jgi:2-methylcitrate dehydratase PrpD
MGFDQPKILGAMSIGGAFAGWCPVGAVYDDGGTIKPMLHGAWPAGVGVTAARYAAAGVTGPVLLLESKIGLLSTLAFGYEPQAISDPGVWHLANPRRKLHAACGYTHAATDTVARLQRKMGKALLSAREINIKVPLYTFRAVSKSAPPTTSTQARFHLQYCAALAAIGEDRVRPRHGWQMADYLARPDISALLSIIHVSVDERLKHYEQCSIDVVTTDGTTVHIDGEPPRGAPANPMSKADVIEKFSENVGDVISADDAKRYTDTVMAIETLPNCDALYAPFVR